MATRDGALERAREHFDSGAFLEALARRIAIPTESQIPERQPELYRYLEEEMKPEFEAMDHEVRIFDNPVEGRGPVLIASRIEDSSLPTMLSYGHGDVVTSFPEEWDEGLKPYEMKIDGERVYGRGVVDNKGQHCLGMAATKAVLDERGGRLGYNSKFIIETGEEQGSHGLEPFIQSHTDLLATDIFLGIDGPRHSLKMPEVVLGSRGAAYFDLIVDLKREGGLHSGHWGGVMPDAGIILAQAISSITTPKGVILIDDWLPKSVPNSVRAAARDLVVDKMDNIPEPEDPEWGDMSLTKEEKVMTNTSVIVLAYRCGNPDNPVNSVPSYARARLQVRHVADVKREALGPALEKHFAAQGFGGIEVVETGRELFPAHREDPDNPWVRHIVKSLERTHGGRINICPGAGGSGPRGFFANHLDCVAMIIPNSYAGCGQHGPNEHGLKPLFREGIANLAGIYWDAGEPDAPGRS
ncbi:MAG: M20/M25/M40 family metallo-hydrolase [Acetobacterales bacterium]